MSTETTEVQDNVTAPSTGLSRYLDQLRYWRQDLRDALPEIPGVPYLYISPFFILFGVFLAFPVVYTIYLSFFRYQGVSDATLLWIDLGFTTVHIQRMANLQFVGLANYARMLSDGIFHQALYNTFFIFVVQVPLMVSIALVLALALNASFVRFKGIFRTTLALPVAANTAAYSTVFLLLLNEQLGFINYVLAELGSTVLSPLLASLGIAWTFTDIQWLTNPFWARMSVIGAMTWRWMGYNMIILLAGLQNVSERLYEAAEIDGASRLQKFRHVTIPQLRPVLLFVFVTSTIGTFRLFTEPYIITGGGPGNATTTIVYYIYEQAFQNFNFGYASAVTWLLVVIVSIVSIVQIRLGGENNA